LLRRLGYLERIHQRGDPLACAPSPDDAVREPQAVLPQPYKRWLWELELEELGVLCRGIPQLGILVLSVHPSPLFSRLENEEAVLESLAGVKAAAPGADRMPLRRRDTMR
jgi:hypothetical protein